jgi:sugar lactone lactonase YvrE
LSVTREHRGITRISLAIGLVVAAAGVAGAVAVLRIDPSGQEGNRLPAAYNYDISQYKRTDPALIQYAETGGFPASLAEARAIAVGPDDKIYVAGDRTVLIFDAQGRKLAERTLVDPPGCLTVDLASHAGRVYVGMADHVEVYAEDGSRLAVWPSLSPKALLTSLAAGREDFFAADAGNRIVWHYDLEGKLLGRIGDRDVKHDVPGFVVPSPYFDLALDPDGLLWVVNPASHHLMAFNARGQLKVSWGKTSLAVDGFSGCCNPANIAILPDGSIVTAEKGVPRIKVYSSAGDLAAVVAGPETLAPTATITEETRSDHKLGVFDVAADSAGRILVLDPTGRRVRIFQRKHRVTKENTGG